jgi:hypothetical protein
MAPQLPLWIHEMNPTSAFAQQSRITGQVYAVHGGRRVRLSLP